MTSHPFTSAQRMNPMQIFDSVLARGVPSDDPSFEPWREHTYPAITRARIADARITSAMRIADARITSAMRNVTIRDMADIARVADRPALTNFGRAPDRAAEGPITGADLSTLHIGDRPIADWTAEPCRWEWRDDALKDRR